MWLYWYRRVRKKKKNTRGKCIGTALSLPNDPITVSLWLSHCTVCPDCEVRWAPNCLQIASLRSQILSPGFHHDTAIFKAINQRYLCTLLFNVRRLDLRTTRLPTTRLPDNSTHGQVDSRTSRLIDNSTYCNNTCAWYYFFPKSLNIMSSCTDLCKVREEI